MTRFRSFLLISLCAITLAGCSVLYNYRVADWWLRWYVGGYVQWDDAQNKLFRERLLEQLHWHRDTQLQRYRAWLEAGRHDLAGRVTVPQLQQQADQVQQFWTDIMLQLEPDITALLAGLSEQQVREMMQRMREDQSDLIEKYGDLSLQELRKERVRDIRKAIEGLTGPLDKQQRARIAQWAELLPDGREGWLASRARWRDAFEQALARRHERDYFAGRMHILFVTPRENWDPEYAQRIEQNARLTLEMLADVHNSLSAQQHAKLDANLVKWIGIIDELAASH